LLGAFVPVNQPDFGCREVLIGGGARLEKGQARPRWGVCSFLGKPSLGQFQKTGERINGEA
jgi:hypothetical protein